MYTYGSPRAVALAGPYMDWGQGQSADAQGLVSGWAARISAVPRTQEVAGSVVDTLLQIAANPYLRPFIPAEAWSWLNERPSLPPACKGLLSRCDRDIVRTVRALGDIGILTSYLIVIWSASGALDDDGFAEMEISVREDFKGVGMGYYRAELIQRLDYILTDHPSRRSRATQLEELQRSVDAALGRESRDTKGQYRAFKKVLQVVDRKANEILNRMPSSSIFLNMLTLNGPAQVPAPPSRVPYLSRVRNLAFWTIDVV